MASAQTGEVAIQVCSEGNSKFARMQRVMLSYCKFEAYGSDESCSKESHGYRAVKLSSKREAMSKKRMGMTEVYFALHLTTGFDIRKRFLRW